MYVNFFVRPDDDEHADFYVKAITPEYQQMAQTLQQSTAHLWGFNDQTATPVAFSDIVHIYTENRYVVFCTISDKFRSQQRIYELETALPATFLRISNSEIINFQAIHRLEWLSNGQICVYLKNNSQTYVSRRFVKTLKGKLGL